MSRLPMSQLPVLFGALVLLAATTAPAQQRAADQRAADQDRAVACRRDTDRFAALFPNSPNDRPNNTGTSTDIPNPQPRDTERTLSRNGGVLDTAPIGSGVAPPVGGSSASRSTDGVKDTPPGGRRGAHLGDDQRRRLGDLIREARAAAGRGDPEDCLQRLGEARALARDSGFGVGRSSGGLGAGNGNGSGSGGAAGTASGSGGGAGSTNPALHPAPGAGMGGANRSGANRGGANPGGLGGGPGGGGGLGGGASGGAGAGGGGGGGGR